MTLYDKYIDQVTSGEIVVGEMVKLAVQRHLNDLKRQNTPEFPYYFDKEQADRVIAFMGKLKLTGGAYRGKYWKVEPFQAFYFSMVYGWKKQETGFRRFRTVYFCTARKSAKSEKSGGEEVWHLLADGEGSPQIVNVATTRDQAAYVYNAARYMSKELAKESRYAAERVVTKQYRVDNPDNGGYITCLTSDATTNDGGNPHFASIDEYHAHPDDSMIGVTETGMGMRDQPILKITTTAGFNKQGPDFVFRDMCRKILRGQIENETIFALIYELDEADDWTEEKNWPKANPLIGITPKWDFMRNQYQKAITEAGEKLVEFKTKNLNMYVDSASTWIEDSLYMACTAEKQPDLVGKYCYVGVDLASESDLTAANYFFPKQPGLDKPYYFTNYYCPESKFSKVRVDGVIYGDWLEGGWVKKTPGNVIDKNLILDDILANAELYNVKAVGYDPHKAVDLISTLVEKEFTCIKVVQSAVSMSPGYCLWKENILKKEVEHEGSPVTRWQMGNIIMYKDGNDNIKALKNEGKKQNKIDGPVAICNSLVTYLHFQMNPEEEEISDISQLGYLG